MTVIEGAAQRQVEVVTSSPGFVGKAGSPAEVSRTPVRSEKGNAQPRDAIMLIESTEQFHASAAIAIRRGPNEVAESDYARLPAAIRTKLRILHEHGVVRLSSPSEPDLIEVIDRE